jgi:catechol 2,3-dioxygenase-like lactoylglutathione lyase family enzyme
MDDATASTKRTDAAESVGAVEDPRYRPTRPAAFTGVGQVGIIVRDLDATLRRYVDDFGIGPWQTWEVTPENAPGLLHDGEPMRGATRCAATMVGGVMWEVFQPLDDHGIFARHLAERGEGVHHIAVTTPDYHGVIAEHTGAGQTLPLSGSFAGVDVAYLPTEQTLGVLLEVFSGFPDADAEPDAT